MEGGIKSQGKFSSSYKKLELLGKGGFSEVYSCRSKKDPSVVNAVKIISKQDMTEDDLYYILNEIDILSKIDHPNIVRFFELFDDEDSLYLVFENMKGGDVRLSNNLFIFI